MLLPMLKAANKMIANLDDLPTLRERCFCASAILTEMIKFYEDTPIPENPKPVSKEKTQATTPQLQPKATLEPRPEVEIPVTEKEWFVTISDKGDLFIQDFPEDGLVEVDGKKMKYSESRGLKFKKPKSF